MKKWLILPLFLLFVLGAGLLTVTAETQGAAWSSKPAIDPEPPVEQAVGGVAPEDAIIEATLEPAWVAAAASDTNHLSWGDYDLDGDLDLLVANLGENVLYTNIGRELTPTHTFLCEPGMVAADSRSIEWGDFDRDGYLDFAIGNFGRKNCIFHNEGDGTFARDWLAEIAQNTTSVAWAGWEAGGESLSFLAVGHSGDANAVYRYEAGDFDLWWTDPTGTSGATRSMAWGDYDRDGYPDLAVGNFGQANYIFRNNPASNTLDLVYSTPALSYTTSLAWGDMNGDGWIDLAVGNGGTTGRTDRDQVLCNPGPTPPFEWVPCWTSGDASPTADVTWGDYDGDGDLDLAVASGPDATSRVYVNQGGMLGTSPAREFDDEVLDGRAVAWADWDGDGDLELTLGYFGAFTTLYDNTVGAMSVVDVSAHVLDTRQIVWGDVDGDGWIDLAVANSSSSPNQLFYNTGGALDPVPWQSPEAENTRSLAWGDFDDDGDLDLAAGNGLSGGSASNRVYINQGGALVSSWTYGGGNSYSVAWGDFDGDQDLDLAVGNYEPNQPNEIYISGVSEGVHAFTGTLVVGPATDNTYSVAWADFDQDFDLDLAVGNDNGPNRVYINDGGSLDTDVTLPGSYDTRSVAWGDWNGDGYPDLAVANAGSNGFVQVLETREVTGTWAFEEVWRSTELYLDVRSVAWGDYDGDGDLDLAVGVHGQFERRNLIYRNMGATFAAAWKAPAAYADPTRSVAWADWDNDGDLDLATGNFSTPAGPNRVYVNNWHAGANLANDPTYVVLEKPGGTDEASFLANYEILGTPKITINYTLFDDEWDRAFAIQPQVSWDGGGSWEPAWEGGGSGTDNLSASPTGVAHTFEWDTLNQVLDHQGLTIPVPPNESQEEMDIAFRILVWANPDHGGLIQRPAFGSNTTLFRVDMRPDWYDSVKLAAPQVVHPGEEIEFSIVITQADHGLPPSAVITDVLPVELAVVGTPSANLGDVTWATDVVTWTGAIPFRAQLQVHFNAEVTLPLTNNLVLTNCAEIFDGLHPQFSRCTTAVISSTPTLDTSFKRVNDVLVNTAFPGDPLTYTIVLTNTGTENAWHGVLLTDSLPAELTWAGGLTATSGVATFVDGLLTWQGVVDVYEPVTITYHVTVVKPLPGNTLITNTAWIYDGVNPAFDISPHVTTWIIAPDLGPSAKYVSASVAEMGDVLTYTIVLTNDGALPATDATLFDAIPAGSAYVSPSVQATAGAAGYDAVTDAITWTGEILVGEAVTVTFAITAGPPNAAGAIIENRANVEDPVGGPLTLVATTTLLLPDWTGSTKSGSPAWVDLGDPLTYTLVISNSGGRAPYALVSDPLPANAVYVIDSLSSSDDGAVYEAGAARVVWQGAMEHGDVVTISFGVLAGCPLTTTVPVVINRATIVDDTGAVVEVVKQTQLRLPNLATSQKLASAPSVVLGETITYTVIVRNTGGDAPDVWFSDPLPQGTSWLDSYQASQGTVHYTAWPPTVTWLGGALDSGDEATIEFQVRVNHVGTITNTVEIGYSCDSVTKEVIVEAVSAVFRHYLPVLYKWYW